MSNRVRKAPTVPGPSSPIVKRECRQMRQHYANFCSKVRCKATIAASLQTRRSIVEVTDEGLSQVSASDRCCARRSSSKRFKIMTDRPSTGRYQIGEVLASEIRIWRSARFPLHFCHSVANNVVNSPSLIDDQEIPRNLVCTLNSD